jgi:hypothetical protein
MAKKKPNSMLAYTTGVSESDKAKNRSYYQNEADKLGKKPGAKFPDLNPFKDAKQREIQDKNYNEYHNAVYRINSQVADQDRWIAKGAKANALAQMKLKKKGK